MLTASVFLKTVIDHAGKSIQIQLIKLIVQQFGGLQRVQFPRRLLLDKPDTVKAVIAVSCLIEHAAARTHPLQKLILLQQQKIPLQLLQAAFRIHMVYPGKYIFNKWIILVHTVLIADPAVPVCRHGKGKHMIGKRRQLPAKIMHPRLPFPVLADHASAPQQIQILLRKRQGYVNTDFCSGFPEILRADPVFTAHRPDGIQHGGFSGIVLPHQDQGILNIRNLHVTDGFEILDVKSCNFHGLPPPKYNTENNGYDLFRKKPKTEGFTRYGNLWRGTGPPWEYASSNLRLQ